ncbi:60S ACIDIC ribosomal protein P2B [Anaeramoeba flamelloides]|uniref:60S ACIDIC ribosomal protein P2B n=1 Tax=Anaeramoeba flamelloides TaxID=1746091 RepID=A0AAV8A2K2_9EUKA|nr:60S ACIDIC ribosomal protein P2B [Anaeramoeba flamelloides]
MSVIPLYSLLVLGGNLKPTEEDLLESYKSLGIDSTNEKERITKFLELVGDKDIFEVLKRGQFEKKKPPQIKIEKETEDNKIEKKAEDNNNEESNQQTTEQTNDPLPDPLLDQINIQEQEQQQEQNQNENNNANQTEEIEIDINLFSD